MTYTKEQRKEYNKQYREKNKEKIIKQSREYYENNQDKIKQYYEKNKDKIKHQMISHWKEYRIICDDKLYEKLYGNKIVGYNNLLRIDVNLFM